ncbi:15-hydroxyprostaglandin dehydrogenase [NAD(+)]-like [Diabrotica undecimpunctata]|uniref:15-hydroxyprostaglandin dehydrogenase [NAD(+)]-like n=1 Tax=Diabrotica undecimpunctata TaxID=50387 RepID=UPI003B63F95F
MVFELKDKVSLVTGGAEGIGLAFAKHLLENGVKAVIIVDINAEKGKSSVGELNTQYGQNKAHFLRVNVTDPEELESAYKYAFEKLDGLDIVINNAGIWNDGEWELEIGINAIAVTRSTFLALRYMGKNNGGKGGVVVNISSIAGLAPMDILPVYSGTKHFVLGFTGSLASPFFYDLTGVSFRVICPGATNTRLIGIGIENTLKDFSGYREYVEAGFSALMSQSPNVVAKCMIKAVTEGENGSVWNPEDNQIHEIKFPDRFYLRKK